MKLFVVRVRPTKNVLVLRASFSLPCTYNHRKLYVALVIFYYRVSCIYKKEDLDIYLKGFFTLFKLRTEHKHTIRTGNTWAPYACSFAGKEKKVISSISFPHLSASMLRNELKISRK